MWTTTGFNNKCNNWFTNKLEWCTSKRGTSGGMRGAIGASTWASLVSRETGGKEQTLNKGVWAVPSEGGGAQAWVGGQARLAVEGSYYAVRLQELP
jgi:hypothetical protein